MPRKKQVVTDEIKELQRKVSELIGKLLSNGFTQKELADNLNLYQGEISQLYRQVRTLQKDRYKSIIEILKKLVEENINPSDSDEASQVQPEYNYGTWLYDQLTELDITPIEFSNESTISYQALNLIISGSTTNPQFRTKQLIEKTLERLSKERKKKIEKKVVSESDEEKLFIGIPFTKSEIEQTPDKIGVYAIHDKRGYPTYIGKGRIKNRLKDHSDRISFASDKVAATFSYYIVQEGESEQDKEKANKESRLMEKIITKFAGNTILLNIQNIEDLSQE